MLEEVPLALGGARSPATGELVSAALQPAFFSPKVMEKACKRPADAMKHILSSLRIDREGDALHGRRRTRP